MWRSSLLGETRHAFTGRAEGSFHDPGWGGRERIALTRELDGTRMVTVRQVHGRSVVDAALVDENTEADAIVSTSPGTIVAVRVADCVPILLVAPGVVAAVHAGWRGTAEGIARAGLRAVCERAGVDAGRVRAAVGPAICGRCYEVGTDVVEAIGKVTPGAGWNPAPRHVDLAEANAVALRDEGAVVDVVAQCTRCGTGLWSHRRDGMEAGRQVGAIRA